MGKPLMALAAIALGAVALQCNANGLPAEHVPSGQQSIPEAMAPPQPAYSAEVVSCQTQAGWGDPYPSIIMLRRLAPQCGAAWVQVIRTNGEPYPVQCATYEEGRLTISTATGDYHLAVERRSLTGDFISKLNPDYSRTALRWQCDAAPSRITDVAPTAAAAKHR